MWNDADLQHDIEKQLEWEPGVHSTQISVAVKGGTVDLGGHVDSFWEKCAAEHATWQVLHVRSINNAIRVTVPFDAMRADDDIALAAMSTLEWNCLVPETVEVQVAGGVLTLSGKVEWQYQKEEAYRALCPLRGVAGIHNEIAVQPAVSAGDVRSSIEDAMKRNVLVDSSHIKAHVSHGVVTVRGTARSRAEYEQAMRAAWAAPGISKVEDHITIGPARGE